MQVDLYSVICDIRKIFCLVIFILDSTNGTFLKILPNFGATLARMHYNG